MKRMASSGPSIGIEPFSLGVEPSTTAIRLPSCALTKYQPVLGSVATCTGAPPIFTRPISVFVSRSTRSAVSSASWAASNRWRPGSTSRKSNFPFESGILTVVPATRTGFSSVRAPPTASTSAEPIPRAATRPALRTFRAFMALLLLPVLPDHLDPELHLPGRGGGRGEEPGVRQGRARGVEDLSVGVGGVVEVDAIEDVEDLDAELDVERVRGPLDAVVLEDRKVEVGEPGTDERVASARPQPRARRGE